MGWMALVGTICTGSSRNQAASLMHRKRVHHLVARAFLKAVGSSPIASWGPTSSRLPCPPCPEIGDSSLSCLCLHVSGSRGSGGGLPAHSVSPAAWTRVVRKGPAFGGHRCRGAARAPQLHRHRAPWPHRAPCCCESRILPIFLLIPL